MNVSTKTIAFVSALLAIFILCPVSVLADDFEVTLSPTDIMINTTDIGTIDILIENNQAVEDTFQISVWPSTTWAGITPDLQKDKVKIAAGANSTVTLYLSVSSSAEEVISTFLVSVSASKLENQTVSSSVSVKTMKKSAVYISDLAVNKTTLVPGECIEIKPSITNDGFSSGSYRLQTSVVMDSTVLQRFDDDVFDIEGKSIETFPKVYCFEDYVEPGRYSVVISLRTDINSFVDTRTASLKMDEISNLVFKKAGIYTPFVQIKTITVSNDGNVVESDFNVTETVSEFTARFFYPVDEPVETKVVNGNTIYVWNIDSLAPGEQVEIKYEVRFIILWASGIGIALLVFIAFSYAYKPKIKKAVRFLGSMKKGKETVVMLEIKNSTINEIKNIVVEDSISPISSLIERFDTIKPVVKKTSSGTSLIWKIKSLGPLEERVLTYRIKPKVDIIGSMRLPRATMSFTDKKKKIKTVASKSIEIK